MPKDSDEQADVRAVRSRLLKMGASCLRYMCSIILPNESDWSWVRQPKQSIVEMLLSHYERLAAMFASVAADTPDTLPAQAAMPPPAAWPLPLAAAPPPPPPPSPAAGEEEERQR